YILTAAQAGDETALRVLESAGRYLGMALAAIIDILNPEIIVLGSLYGRARALLEPAMRRALEQEALPEALRACRVEPAGLGETIGDLAAVSVALYRSGYWET
ncbi:MAG TPA: ROK family protein, partial [Candidatus Brocadiia bacterium]|nr:ROK family protein [Candidatus Brocadiia bacterium]